jgi:hypothetical protein
MERRQFLLHVGGIVLILPTAGYLVACGDSTPPTGQTTTQTPPETTPTVTTGNQQFTFTSSLVSGHTHTFTLSQSELTTPPAGGLQRDTALVQAHVHTVMLTEADLLAIDQNQTVVKVTTVNDGHDHSFSFTKAQA